MKPSVGAFPEPSTGQEAATKSYVDAADGTAIHDNVNAEINAIAAKSPVVAADIMLIEDSAAANAKKKITVADLRITESQITDLAHTAAGGAGTDTTAIHDNVAAEISAITEKASPVGTDLVIIEDSAAANAKKKVQLSNLPTPAVTTGGLGDYIAVNFSADQTASFSANDALAFNQIDETRGDLTLDTVTNVGRISGLATGRTYVLEAVLRPITSAGSLVYGWYDVTAAAWIGSTGSNYPPDSTSTSGPSSAVAVFTPTETTDVELRMVSATATDVDASDATSGQPTSYAIVREIGTIITTGNSGIEFLDEIVLTAAADQVDFGASGNGAFLRALDGDTDAVYIVEGTWVKGVAAASDLSLQPNNLATNQETSRVDSVNGGAASVGTFAGLHLATASATFVADDVIGFGARLAAETGEYRAFRSQAAAVGPGVDSAVTTFGGGWSENSTNITSLRILCSEEDGIGAGSVFRLYRITKSPIRSHSANSYERRIEGAVSEGSSTVEQTSGHTAFGGSLIGLTARLEEAVTAGTVTVNIKAGGTTIATVVLDTTNTTSIRKVYPVGSLTFGADVNLSTEIVAASYTNAASTTSGITIVMTLQNSALINPPDVWPYMPGHIDGLELSWTSVTQVGIAVGSCRSDDNDANIDVTGALTADISTTGANGRDAGSEASSEWYAVLVIAGEGETTASLLVDKDNFPGSITLPSGYTHWRRVGWALNNGSSNLSEFYQLGGGRDREWWFDGDGIGSGSPGEVLVNGTATADTDIDCSGAAPRTAGKLFIRLRMTPATNGNSYWLRENGRSDYQIWGKAPSTAYDENMGPLPITCDTSQIIEYSVSTGSDALDINVLGHVDYL